MLNSTYNLAQFEAFAEKLTVSSSGSCSLLSIKSMIFFKFVASCLVSGGTADLVLSSEIRLLYAISPS